MSSKRMLYIEDDKKLRDEVRKYFTRRQWTIDSASSGSEGLEIIRKKGTGYGVIILDLRMPEMQGEEMLEHIKNEGIDIPPIIVLSAYLDETSAKKCLELGAKCLLQKPYDLIDLEEVISAIMSRNEEALNDLVDNRQIFLDRTVKLPSDLLSLADPKLRVLTREQMSNKKMLYIEDDKNLRDKVGEYFTKRQWLIDSASNGLEGLEIIREKGAKYDVMILDLRMPGMQGEKILERIKDEEIDVPPIIVLSGYLNETSTGRCLDLGVRYLIPKPVELQYLKKIVNIIVSGSGKDLITLPADFAGKGISEIPKDEIPKELIDETAEKREASLLEFFTESSRVRFPFEPKEPLFIVGRRWNSWYPSFFDVPGGAYAILGPYTEAGRNPCCVIDPGFRFLEVFRKLGISLDDIESCVISHNHPDHIGGIFAFLAARYALGKQTRIFCDPATKAMLELCSGFKLEVKELDAGPDDLLSSIEVEGFDTAHRQMAGGNKTKGLSISCSSGSKGKIIILGDTEYRRSVNWSNFIPRLSGNSVKVAVLHIGCSRIKTRTRGHLYRAHSHNLDDAMQPLPCCYDCLRYAEKLP